MRWLFVVALVACGSSPDVGHMCSAQAPDCDQSLTCISSIPGGYCTASCKVAPGDVTEPMHLAPDATPAVDGAVKAEGVPAYVRGWLAIRIPTAAGEVACEAGPASAHGEDSFVVVTWSVACPRPIDLMTFD